MVLRVVCMDDSELCLHGVQHAIERSDFTWLRAVRSIGELESIDPLQQVDILISELRIGSDDVLEYWLEHRKRHADCQLILFSYNDNTTHIARAAACNAWDYIDKRQSIQRLIRSCQSVANRARLPDSSVGIARQFLSRPQNFLASDSHPLTRRERQVLTHLAHGLSNREISNSMSISLETVKEHVQNVLRKIKVSDRTAAAVWAIRNGLPTFAIDSVSLLAQTHPSSTSSDVSMPE